MTDGKLFLISSNPALFDVIGTIYGGDGRTTFAVPDLRGRHASQPNFSVVSAQTKFKVGAVGGQEVITLTPEQLPPNSHELVARSGNGDRSDPSGALLADDRNDRNDRIYKRGGGTETMAPNAICDTGAGQPINLRPPFLGINHIMCTRGIFPSRN